MARAAFDRAWNLLQEPVRRVLQETDASAVVVTLVRFAIHLHMEATQTVGSKEGKALFDKTVEGCYEQTCKDYAAIGPKC